MKRFTLPIMIGNALGAALTFFYFSYTDVSPKPSLGGPASYEYICFVVATSSVFLIVMLVHRYWFSSLFRAVEGETSINLLLMQQVTKASDERQYRDPVIRDHL